MSAVLSVASEYTNSQQGSVNGIGFRCHVRTARALGTVVVWLFGIVRRS